MRRTWRGLLPLVILVVLVGYLYTHRNGSPALPEPAIRDTAAAAPRVGAAQLPAFLPNEARRTLTLIANGGPFPHRQDGTVFGNHEHLLPRQPRGYYHEYTVATPGAGNRGARRIITGGNPPHTWYYTDDHYRSFRAFTVPP